MENWKRLVPRKMAASHFDFDSCYDYDDGGDCYGYDCGDDDYGGVVNEATVDDIYDRGLLDHLGLQKNTNQYEALMLA